jgi:hypothetical protein
MSLPLYSTSGRFFDIGIFADFKRVATSQLKHSFLYL